MFSELCLYHLYYIVLLNLLCHLLLINIFLELIIHFNGLYIIYFHNLINFLQEQGQEQKQEHVQEQKKEQELWQEQEKEQELE